jgi:heat shock protein HtpX
MVFMILGSMLVAWFSRYREYRADEGGARLAGRQNMIDALRALMEVHGMPQMEEVEAHPAVKTLMINSRKKSWANLFATHPPLEDRIRALQARRG